MIQFRNPSTGLIETFKGLKGNDGKSAYEYATSMGYPGSEEDFAKLMSYDAKEAIEKLLQDMAGVANIEEVTQAEYDALGNEKLSNDVMYCIKDADPSNEGEEEEEEPVYVNQLVAGNGSRLVMQDDDNVVAYKADGTHLWDSMSTNNNIANLTCHQVSDLTITKTGGSATLQNMQAWLQGNIITIYFQIKEGSTGTSVGANVFSGTLNKYKPVGPNATGVSFSNSTGILFSIYNNGTIDFRIIGTTMPANGVFAGSITYVTGNL